MKKNSYSSSDLFARALYDSGSSSISLFLENYERMLLERKDVPSVLHANRVKQYRLEVTSKGYLGELRRNFNALYDLIDKEYPDLCFRLEGRIKSATSMDYKIINYIQDYKSLDKLRDTMAFRIFIFGPYSEEELITLCYNIMNSILEHNVTKYTLCDAAPVKGTLSREGISQNKILVPKKSLILPQYSYGVKDYIISPKDNGYQSLHATFRRPLGGECFEIQVRTLDMHLFAETGDANHLTYKQGKYASNHCFDRRNVHIPGYRADSDGNLLYDYVGLENKRIIFFRQKTF